VRVFYWAEFLDDLFQAFIVLFYFVIYCMGDKNTLR